MQALLAVRLVGGAKVFAGILEISQTTELYIARVCERKLREQRRAIERDREDNCECWWCGFVFCNVYFSLNGAAAVH